MDHLHIDFETYSEIDLVEVGTDIYSKHPSTEILCMSFCFDEGPVHLWKKGESFPQDVFEHVACDGEYVAHNATFEILMWNNTLSRQVPGLPLLKPELATCTATRAYNMGFPGSLEKAAAAAGIQQQKDLKGKRVMMQLCKPKEVSETGQLIRYTPDNSPDKFEMLYEYCKQDLIVERELFKRLNPLSKKEKELWLLDYKINRRGVFADIRAAEIANELVAREQERLNELMKQITDNYVPTCSAVKVLTDWIRLQGVDVKGVGKNDVTELLHIEDLPDKVRDALTYRQEFAKSSTAKLKGIVAGASDDNRVRGLFQYYGTFTGRWAGRRVQPQNFPRPNLDEKQIEEVFNIFGG